MELDYKAIGKRVRRYRKSKGLTQEKLADMVEVTSSHISNVENAKTQVSLPLIVNIANVLGVTADELLCDNIYKATAVMAEEINAEMQGLEAVDLWYLEETLRSTRERLRQYRKRILEENSENM